MHRIPWLLVFVIAVGGARVCIADGGLSTTAPTPPAVAAHPVYPLSPPTKSKSEADALAEQQAQGAKQKAAATNTSNIGKHQHDTAMEVVKTLR